MEKYAQIISAVKNVHILKKNYTSKKKNVHTLENQR